LAKANYLLHYPSHKWDGNESIYEEDGQDGKTNQIGLDQIMNHADSLPLALANGNELKKNMALAKKLISSSYID
jgi:hypothetical protein